MKDFSSINAELIKISQKEAKRRIFKKETENIFKPIDTIWKLFNDFYKTKMKQMKEIEKQFFILQQKVLSIQNDVIYDEYNNKNSRKSRKSSIEKLLNNRIISFYNDYNNVNEYLDYYALIFKNRLYITSIVPFFEKNLPKIRDDYQELFNNSQTPEDDLMKKRKNFINKITIFTKLYNQYVISATNILQSCVNQANDKYLQFEKKYFDIVRIYNLYQREKRNYEKQIWYNYQIKKHRWQPYEKIKHQKKKAIKQCLPKLNIQKSNKKSSKTILKFYNKAIVKPTTKDAITNTTISINPILHKAIKYTC